MFAGPDMADAEVRAAVGFLTGTFRISALDPDAHDVWVESVRDALCTSGMSAIFRAADCRVKAEVPVRLRNEADMIERWKLAFAWTAVRRSLNSVPSIFARTQRCKFADIEGMIRAASWTSFKNGHKALKSASGMNSSRLILPTTRPWQPTSRTWRYASASWLPMVFL